MNENFGTICLCAMRYALGRQTYMPGLVQDFIRGHIGEIGTETVEIMVRDIDEADRITEHRTPDGHILRLTGWAIRKSTGRGWEKFRAFLREKMEERKDD